MSEMKDKA